MSHVQKTGTYVAHINDSGYVGVQELSNGIWHAYIGPIWYIGMSHTIGKLLKSALERSFQIMPFYLARY